MLAVILALLQAAHVAPPTPEGHVHPAPTAKVCPVEGVIPPELAGWRAGQRIAAGRLPATIAVGRSVRAMLLPIGDTVFPLAPAKAAAAGTSGGVFAFETTRAGRYRVALGAGAWIDVVHDGRAAKSVAHGHGPDCSPVRKMVDFDLAAGRYLLQVAGSPTPELAFMVARIG